MLFSFAPVSNPNGVNLHIKSFCVKLRVHLGFKPQRGKFTPAWVMDVIKTSGVSNPNGVNLHDDGKLNRVIVTSFKPQRGKFTRNVEMRKQLLEAGFKPQRGKFTQGA